MSIYNTIAVASVGICTGIFNLILSKSGYAAPYTNAAGQLIAVQSESVKSAITFTFVGLETITGIVLAILLLFLNVEKNIAKEQEEIKQRNGGDNRMKAVKLKTEYLKNPLGIDIKIRASCGTARAERRKRV